MTLPTNIDALNKADPNNLPDLLRYMRVGDLLSGHLTQFRDKQVPAAKTNELATLHGLGLPYKSRATSILRAYGRTGTAGTGELAVQAFGATPTSGQIAVSPSGDIVTLAADALTDVWVVYTPMPGEVIELPALPAPAGVLTLPTWVSDRGPIYLLEAEATAATNTGRKIVLANATTNTATTKAALSVDGTKVYFNTATDVVTEARVTLLVSYRAADSFATRLHATALTSV